VVFGGDFQQTLPVVVKGTRADAVHACIRSTDLWRNIVVLRLNQNMRLTRSNNSTCFEKWLLDIGHGRPPCLESTDDSVHVPPNMIRLRLEELISSVYDGLSVDNPLPTAEYFHNRAILAAINEDVRDLNTSILQRFPGVSTTFNSADSYTIESPQHVQNENVPIEFLNSINASGLPVSELTLKPRCPVLLLRNLDVNRGLCNGTRATVLSMSQRVVEIMLLTGDHAGETALIPRISLSPTVTGMESFIKLKRRQFPVQIALAMTINKAQGQTLNHIGLDLRKQVFAHGQLYVALSRATDSNNVAVLLPSLSSCKNTPNVVYKEVLID
jgi:hypothetical protein